jgi:hypothetical protein
MIKGYKASYNGRCHNDFLYEVGKTYEFDGKPICCKQGFHFCQEAPDVVEYYTIYDKEFTLFEVIAHGDIDFGRKKLCTNQIEIVRIIPKEEYKNLFPRYRFKFDDKGNIIHYRGLSNLTVDFFYDDNGICIREVYSTGSVYERDETGKWKEAS